jgi:hypothetical protein
MLKKKKIRRKEIGNQKYRMKSNKRFKNLKKHLKLLKIT